MKCKADGAPVVGAVIVCAGRGTRSGLCYNKILHYIGKRTVIECVLDVFSRTSVKKTVLVISPDDEGKIAELILPYRNVSLCYGGDTRGKSVLNGLKALDGVDVAVIHDGARPFVTPEIIENSIASALEFGSGIAAVPAVDTVKQVSPEHKIIGGLKREELYNVQTPQTFIYKDILRAYSLAGDKSFTDDEEVYAAAGYTPTIVAGGYDNIKITTPDDLFRTAPRGTHVGIGFDVHRLVEGRKLILGGVRIDYERGLLGHSDADVLTHAVMDALLSAAGLPDIGVLFPDTAEETLDISSMILLDKVKRAVKSNGFYIDSVSAVVIAQAPKLASHLPDIRKSLADGLNIDITAVNVSATTTEHLGIIGNGDAIASSASCLLSERK